MRGRGDAAGGVDGDVAGGWSLEGAGRYEEHGDDLFDTLVGSLFDVLRGNLFSVLRGNLFSSDMALSFWDASRRSWQAAECTSARGRRDGSGLSVHVPLSGVDPGAPEDVELAGRLATVLGGLCWRQGAASWATRTLAARSSRRSGRRCRRSRAARSGKGYLIKNPFALCLLSWVRRS